MVRGLCLLVCLGLAPGCGRIDYDPSGADAARLPTDAAVDGARTDSGRRDGDSGGPDAGELDGGFVEGCTGGAVARFDADGLHRVRIPEFTTGSVAFVPIPDATLTLDAATPWLVLVSAGLSSTARELELQYEIDGEPTAGGRANAVQGAGGISAFQHFTVVDTTADATVTASLRAVEGEATVRWLQLVAYRLPGTAVSAEQPAERMVAAGAWSPVETLVVPGAIDSDWFVLATVLAAQLPATCSLALRLRDPMGNTWPIEDGSGPLQAAHWMNPRRDFRAFFVARRVPAPAAGSYVLEGVSNPDGVCGPEPSTVRSSRIVAFPWPGSPFARDAQDVAPLATLEAGPVQRSLLNVAGIPGRAGRLVLGTMMLNTSSGRAWVRRGGVDRVCYLQRTSTLNKLSYAFFDAEAADVPTLYETAFGHEAGGQTLVRESSIHVLYAP